MEGALQGAAGVLMADDVKDELLALAEDVRTLAEIERGRGLRRISPARAGDLPAVGLGAGSAEEAPEAVGESPRHLLHRGGARLVFGVGRGDADLVVVAEAPGFHEDQEGEAFGGPAWAMLDRMLENVLGLARAEVYLFNIVKRRSQEGYGEGADEGAACASFLHERLEAIRPRVLLVLGSGAFKVLFDTPESITRARGNWKDLNGVSTMPTFHPAYLLRKPGDKRLAFEDLKKVRARYDSLTGRS